MAKMEVKNGNNIIMNKELQISQRGVDMPASPIRKLAPLAYEAEDRGCLLYTSPSPRDAHESRMPSSA